ncbi:hypothetical protein VTL71DRAFT_5471 [Oculimacula yallundae]|uniref:Uncharacterized protein n=1 Tax=Oculimacula yallundae TaxID=86028 RepID=A0ABR4C2C6_9HELO
MSASSVTMLDMDPISCEAGYLSTHPSQLFSHVSSLNFMLCKEHSFGKRPDFDTIARRRGCRSWIFLRGKFLSPIAQIETPSVALLESLCQIVRRKFRPSLVCHPWVEHLRAPITSRSVIQTGQWKGVVVCQSVASKTIAAKAFMLDHSVYLWNLHVRKIASIVARKNRVFHQDFDKK